MKYSSDSKIHGSTANFSCNPGFNLTSTSRLTCGHGAGANGTWSGTEPTCVRSKT